MFLLLLIILLKKKEHNLYLILDIGDHFSIFLINFQESHHFLYF